MSNIAVVDGISRICKLISLAIPSDAVQITPALFDDVAKTVNYKLDNYSNLDLIVEVGGETIGYAHGRGEKGKIWLTKKFSDRIKLSLE